MIKIQQRQLSVGRSLLAFGLLVPSLCTASELSNDRYRMQLEADGTLLISAGGCAPQRFAPVFTVLATDKDPQMAMRPLAMPGIQYNVPTWQTGRKDLKRSLAKVDTKVNAGDGFDERIQKGDQEGRTADLFQSAPAVTLQGTCGVLHGRVVTWTLPNASDFTLQAVVTLPPGTLPPELRFTFTPKTERFYSVGYTGAPASEYEKTDELWPPLIFTDRRFPSEPVLTPAYECPLPGALATRGGVTAGLLAASAELPFQPLPVLANSRFGVAVRNAQGQVQPMLFAPMLGGAGSKIAPGQAFSFRTTLLVSPAPIPAVYAAAAREQFAFADLRRNTETTLNQTLANMIEYGLSAYSQFNEDLRGCAYETDVPGAVKNIAALHPLAMALVTDDERIYRTRARPLTEYLLSREKYLFAVSPEIKIQNPSWLLKGPCTSVSELTALYGISQNRNPLLLQYAQEFYTGQRTRAEGGRTAGKWFNALALYRVTGEAAYLEKAKRGADEYLARRMENAPTDFADADAAGMFFFTSFAPKWMELLELYEQTREAKYLDASYAAAKRFTQFIYLCPQVPQESVTVNPGGVAPMYWYLKGKGHFPMNVPEEQVPAWRLSEQGLTAESCTTAAGHRAILLATHAPWMLRLAHYKNDAFLRDIARSAIVGRYANFPGYHINTARTTVYEKAEYPLREHKQLSYNSFHYNHIWPHVALLMDYLVADAFDRSGGAIDFPSRYAEGYGYVQNKVYGDRPGTIYGEGGRWLWMPRDLLQVDNVQINHLAARSDKGLYLVLTNQSPEATEVTVTLNAPRAGLVADQAYPVRVWQQNQPVASQTLTHGSVRVKVAGSGITVLAIDGLKVDTRFQHKALAATPALSGQSHTILPDGGTHAMLLSFGKELTHAYVYLQATNREVKQATLHYRLSGQPMQITDERYPFEFTVELPGDAASFDFSIETQAVDGTTTRSAEAHLIR